MLARCTGLESMTQSFAFASKSPSVLREICIRPHVCQWVDRQASWIWSQSGKASIVLITIYWSIMKTSLGWSHRESQREREGGRQRYWVRWKGESVWTRRKGEKREREVAIQRGGEKSEWVNRCVRESETVFETECVCVYKRDREGGSEWASEKGTVRERVGGRARTQSIPACSDRSSLETN